MPLKGADMWAAILFSELAVVWGAVWFRQRKAARLIRRRLSEVTGAKRAMSPPWARLAARAREQWVRRPQAASLHLRLSEYQMVRIGSVLVPAAVGDAVRGILGAVILGIVGFAGVALYIRWRQSRWLHEIERELPDFLQAVATAMRAGISFQQALTVIGRDTPGPLGQEILRIMRRESLGYSLDEVLGELSARIPSKDMELVVTAVIIQREIGGALSSILDNIVETIRERERVRAEVRTLTAQGRMSGWVLIALPIGVALLISFVNPQYLEPLIKTRTGWFMVGGSVMSLAVGATVIQKLVRSVDID